MTTDNSTWLVYDTTTTKTGSGGGSGSGSPVTCTGFQCLFSERPCPTVHTPERNGRSAPRWAAVPRCASCYHDRPLVASDAKLREAGLRLTRRAGTPA